MSSTAYIVALTGGIGSGKSTIAGIFSQCGAHVIDTDVLAHSLTACGGRALAAICRVFGEDALDVNGALDRLRMRERVFVDGKARAELEAILHPMIREEVEGALSSESVMHAPYAMLVVPLLFETMGYRRRSNRSLAVDCPVGVQRRRVKKRSGLAMQEIDRILSSQLGRSLRLQLADDVISNAGDPAALSSQVLQLHGRYAKLAAAVC